MSFLLVSTEPNNSSNFASNSSCKSFENNSSSLVLSSIGSTGASSCFFTFSLAFGWACGVGGVIGFTSSSNKSSNDSTFKSCSGRSWEKSERNSIGNYKERSGKESGIAGFFFAYV